MQIRTYYPNHGKSEAAGGGGTLAWWSDWRNATGFTDAALLDGGKWTGYVGDPDFQAQEKPNREWSRVMSASGLGFPAGMTNVWEYDIPDYRDPDPQPGIQPRVAGQWTMPAVGEYQYYRYYIRCDFPAGHNPADQHFFHIGDDAGAASYESTFWLNGIEGGSPPGSVGSSGEYRIQFMPNWQSTATTDTAWYNIYLTTTQVYRVEMRAYRPTTNEVRYTMRIYDSSNNLRDASPSQVWFEYYGAQGWTDLPDFDLDITAGTAANHFEIIEVGYNGSSPTGVFTPQPVVKIGGVAIRVSASSNDWIGQYPVVGVED